MGEVLPRQEADSTATLNGLVRQLADNSSADPEMLDHANQAMKVLADLEHQKRCNTTQSKARAFENEDDLGLATTLRKNGEMRKLLGTALEIEQPQASILKQVLDEKLILKKVRRHNENLRTVLTPWQEQHRSRQKLAPVLCTAAVENDFGCGSLLAAVKIRNEELKTVLGYPSTHHNAITSIVSEQPEFNSGPLRKLRTSAPVLRAAPPLPIVSRGNLTFEDANSRVAAVSEEEMERYASYSHVGDMEREHGEGFQQLVASLRLRLDEMQRTDLSERVDVNSLYSDEELRRRLQAADRTVRELQNRTGRAAPVTAVGMGVEDESDLGQM